MNIITVFPISRGAFKERLSYWSAHAFHPGSIIEAPFRGKTIPVLVESVTPASTAKQDIKNAEFMTRKIEAGTERRVVSAQAIRAAARTAEYFVSPPGAVMKAVIPEAVLSGLSTAPNKGEKITSVPAGRDDVIPEILSFQSPDENRAGAYKSIVREEFARKRSVLMIAPTVLVAEELAETLKRGIEPYTFILHGGLSKKQQLDRWQKAAAEAHPIVVIATPLFSTLPRRDIGTVILEKESSRAYFANGYGGKNSGAKKGPPRKPQARRAYFDHRSFIEYYAREIGVRLILGDSLLRIETLHRRERGEIHDLTSSSFRIERLPQILIVNMADAEHKEKNKEKDPSGRNEGFAILGEELLSMVEYAKKRKERVLIFCARRGLAPQTVCGDCGQTVSCLDCGAPVVLHQSGIKTGMRSEDGHASDGAAANAADKDARDARLTDNGRFFLCHHCGRKRSALEPCAKCGNWKLVTLGIGIDTVAAELGRHFPDLKVFKIDKDTASTDKQAQAVLQQFLKTQSAVLLGTETLLSYFPIYSPLTVKYVAVASLDSLFSIPDFRINERIAHIILRLMNKTESHMIIQTRNAESPLIRNITAGSLAEFYKEEIGMRKMLKYPPFSIFIKITVEASKETAAREMEKLLAILEPWNPMIFPAFVPAPKGNAVLHMLLSLSHASWPDSKLKNILEALPPDFAVKVNPESLL